MALTTQQIFDAYYTVATEPGVSAVQVLHALLLASLAPNRRRVYQCVYDAGRDGITTREIAGKLHRSIQSCDNALKELHDMHMLIRSEEHGKSGLFYVYKMKDAP